MSWFKKFFEKEDWRMVATLEHGCSYGTPAVPGKVYCYLFESNFGRRKYDLKITFQNVEDDKTATFFVTTELYLKTVYPWMAGRKLPNIPSYSEVPAEDFMNHMKS